MTMGFAMLGSGLIVPDCWLPVFRSNAQEWPLLAIWSRSEARVTPLLPTIQEFSPNCTAHWGDDGLQRVLANPNIHAVVIALPAQAQIDIALKALAAGKHVLQEKPIGATLQQAMDAVKHYQNHHPRLLWGIAENYRSENVFLRAREVVQGLGNIIKIDLIVDMPMAPGNKYFSSAWRRDTSAFPGGFMVDSGVHYIAAMRTIARTAGCGEVVTAAGRAFATTEQLPPPDSLVGYVLFQDGTPASVSFSFSAAQVRFSLSFVGSKGSLEVQRGGWGIGRGEYTLQYKREQDPEPVKEPCHFSGFPNEVASFAAAAVQVQQGLGSDGEDAYRVSCVEGARDQAVVDALLRSSAGGGKEVDVVTV